MSKIIKNLRVFFLWLACLVITAHLVMPHDHHSGDSFSSKEDICPVSNGKTGHNSGFPVHCHALNDLASEKTVVYFFSESNRYHDTGTSRYFDSFTHELQLPGITYIIIQEPILKSYFLEITPLRAPPSLS